MSRQSHLVVFGTVTGILFAGILFVGTLGGMVLLAPGIQAQQKTASAPVAVSAGSPQDPGKSGGVKTGGDAAGQPVLLRMHFKPGLISRYRMSMRASLPTLAGAQGAPAHYDTNIDLVLQQKVMKVRPDGSADITVSTTSGSGVVNGSPFKPQDSPSLITLDERNNIIAAKRLPSDQPPGALTGTMFQTGELSTQGVYLPKQPVKVGDVWTEQVGIHTSQKDAQKDVKAALTGTVKSTFVRLETIGLFNTVRLHSEVRVPFVVNEMVGKLSMNYDTNVSLSTGQVVQSAGSGDITLDVRVPAGASGSSGSGTGKKAGAHPSAAGTGTKSGGAPATQKSAGDEIQRVVMKLQLGNNLITP